MPQQEILMDFGMCAKGLTQWLMQNPRLEIVDKVLIENHLQILQLAYARCTRTRLAQQEGRGDLFKKAG